MERFDLVVIGGGPAGMAAAVAAKERGIERLLILEREARLGGILMQCIHNGFGLHRFKEELTGPEYAARYEERVRALGIEARTEATVLSLARDRIITVTDAVRGIYQICAGAVILAMGCRERPRGALNIAGSRPAGVYTAGAAQKLVNIKGLLPGKRVVILGSGDIGLIMARRMTLEGAKVEAVCELMPYSGGLTRNIVQCLEDFGIPLYLSHTITQVHGRERVSGVTVTRVDGNLRPVYEDSMEILCDTLLLSVGLIPENELTLQAGIRLDPITKGPAVNQLRQTAAEGIFACGNVLHVHDLVDYVSAEAEIAGRAAADYLMHGAAQAEELSLSAGEGIRYVLPQRLRMDAQETELFFRASDVIGEAEVALRCGEKIVKRMKCRRLAPGEMQKLHLNREELASLRVCDKLILEVSQRKTAER